MNGQGKHILIVDDEPAIVDLLQDYLGSLGYSVTPVNTAEEAIQLLSNGERIDLILSDINLPGMTGIELLKIARSTKKGVPVVLITGVRTLEYAISAIKNGAQDYINKPFDLNNVRRVVQKVLKKQSKNLKKERIFEFLPYLKLRFDIPTYEIDPGVVADYLARILLKTRFCDEDEYNQYNLAFTETIINAIEHGNLELSSSLKGDDFVQWGQFEEMRARRMQDPHYGNRKVQIIFEYCPDLFSLNITDKGPGFDWRKYVNENHKLKVANLESHGRGFVFIHNIIDEVYFNTRGNSITLIKHKNSGGK